MSDKLTTDTISHVNDFTFFENVCKNILCGHGMISIDVFSIEHYMTITNDFIRHLFMYEKNNPNVGTLFFQHMVNYSFPQIVMICLHTKQKNTTHFEKIIATFVNSFSCHPEFISYLHAAEAAAAAATKTKCFRSLKNLIHQKIALFTSSEFLNLLEHENRYLISLREKLKNSMNGLIVMTPISQLTPSVVPSKEKNDFHPKWDSIYPISRHTMIYIHNMKQNEKFKFMFSINVSFDEFYIDDDLNSEIDFMDDDVCSLCLNQFTSHHERDSIKNIVKTSCHHFYCKKCFADYTFYSCLLNENRHEFCSLCKNKIKFITNYTLSIS